MRPSKVAILVLVLLVAGAVGMLYLSTRSASSLACTDQRCTAPATFHLPPARQDASIGYDPDHRQVILFGGLGASGALGDTWAWDGRDWHELNPPVSPPLTQPPDTRASGGTPSIAAGTPLFWDPATHELLGLGAGQAAANGVAQVMWAWNGTTWTSRPGPGLVGSWSMAYDAVSRRMILLEHIQVIDPPTVPDRVWAWDGAAWSRLETAGAQTTGGTLFVDWRSGRVSVIGDTEAASGSGMTVWRWNGEDWRSPRSVGGSTLLAAGSQSWYSAAPRGELVWYDSRGRTLERWTGTDVVSVTPPQLPSQRSGAAIAPTDAGGLVVLFGGADSGGLSDDMWLWNGTTWTRWGIRPAAAAAGHGGHHWSVVSSTSLSFGDSARSSILPVATYDATHATAVVIEVPTGADLRATSLWDGHRWSTAPGAQTSPLEGAQLVADPASGQVLQIGVSPFVKPVSLEARAWDGAAWSDTGTLSQPDTLVGNNPVAVYDSTHHDVVLVVPRRGDVTAAPVRTATWDGHRWTESSSSSEAAPAAPGALVDDPHDGGALYLTVTGETWLWDGTQWRLAAPAQRALARSTSLAYDPRHQTVVLFGGVLSGVSETDTWTWDGRSWAEHGGAHPDAVMLSSLVDDPGLGAVVLLGRPALAGAGTRLETWTWDGNAWTEQQPTALPIVWIGPSTAVFWDPAAGKLAAATSDGRSLSIAELS